MGGVCKGAKDLNGWIDLKFQFALFCAKSAIMQIPKFKSIQNWKMGNIQFSRN